MISELWAGLIFMSGPNFFIITQEDLGIMVTFIWLSQNDLLIYKKNGELSWNTLEEIKYLSLVIEVSDGVGVASCVCVCKGSESQDPKVSWVRVLCVCVRANPKTDVASHTQLYHVIITSCYPQFSALSFLFPFLNLYRHMDVPGSGNLRCMSSIFTPDLGVNTLLRVHTHTPVLLLLQWRSGSVDIWSMVCVCGDWSRQCVWFIQRDSYDGHSM